MRSAPPAPVTGVGLWGLLESFCSAACSHAFAHVSVTLLLSSIVAVWAAGRGAGATTLASNFTTSAITINP